MYFKHVLTILLLFVAGFLSAQGWERVYGGGGQDELHSVAVTPDGGFILAGYYNINRVSLIKTDADGNQQWSKLYPPGAEAVANSVIVAEDGSYLVTGYRFTPPTQRNVFLMKVDAFGTMLWEKNYGNARNEEGFDLVELGDGSIAICGYREVSDTTEQLFILRTDGSGNQLWWNNYGTAAFKKKGRAIEVAPNGDLVVAGDIENSGPDNRDMYVVRADDLSGNLIWAKRYGLTDTNNIPGDETAYDLIPDGNNFVLVGVTNSYPGGGRGHPKNRRQRCHK